ncbi:MAG: AAA family ATPase [Actinomycetota bacterium]
MDAMDGSGNGSVSGQRGSTKILVVDRRGHFTTDLADAAAGLEPAPEILRLRQPTQVIDAVTLHKPDVIIAGPEETTHAGLKRLAKVHKSFPHSVILLTPNGHSELSVAEIAASGVYDVLPYPTTTGRLRAKVRAALNTATRPRPQRHVSPETVAPPATRVGHVMTVTSATGGCGKTFFATNMAAYLTKATGGKVLLVDLDLQFGEVAISLRFRSPRSIAELIDEDDIAAVLPTYVMRHDAGFDVLCAPEDPLASERIGPVDATRVLTAAQGQYDYVVVDTPPALNEVVLAAFDRSRSLVVMATMDVPSLRNLRVFLSTLERLQLDAEQVSLILNKEEQGTGIDVARLQKIYPQGFSAVLPYATEVTRSINRGQPVIVMAPTSDISRSFVAGAKRLVTPNDQADIAWEPPRRSGFFSRFFRPHERPDERKELAS